MLATNSAGIYAGVIEAIYPFGRAMESVFQRSAAEAETVRGSLRPRLTADCWWRFCARSSAIAHSVTPA
jgi:hypothetical protein